MKWRGNLDRLRADVRAEADRVRIQSEPPVVLVAHDGTPESLAAMAAALRDAPEYLGDGSACIAVIIDMSAGEGDLDPITGQVIGDGYDDSDDTAPVLTIVRPPRRVPWDDVRPVPGVHAGLDSISGRPWYGWHDGQRLYGLTDDGEPVGLDSVGPVILESAYGEDDI